jgi:hypothetical protein
MHRISLFYLALTGCDTLSGLLQVVGGLLVHQQRYARIPNCANRFAKLASKCTTALAAEGHPSAASDSKDRDVHPFGQDAVFLPKSDLFDGDAAAHIADFYNLSVGAREVPEHGTPNGFFSHPLPSFPPGFPVVFEVGSVSPSCLEAVARQGLHFMVCTCEYLHHTHGRTLSK